MSINFNRFYLLPEERFLPDIVILNKEIDKYYSELPEIEVKYEEIV